MPRRHRRRILTVLTAGALLSAPTLIGAAGPAQATAPTCTSTASTRVPGITIADPSCGFTASNGSSVYAGILKGSAYRIEVPARWNGSLVMYAHGFAGTGQTVAVQNPSLRSYYLANGFAWAASSYRQNGYNVGDGVIDTHDLLVNFRALTHQRAPRTTYLTGPSMGGEITVAALERYRGTFAGAMPYCGAVGGNRLFDYFLGANVTAAALTDTTIDFPATAAAGVAYAPTYAQQVQGQLTKLGVSTATAPYTTNLTPVGQQWSAAVEQLSGGTRPGFAGALAYWNGFGFPPVTSLPFLFGIYPGLSGGTIGYADGNVTDNTRTAYQLDNKRGLSRAERELNAKVLRVAATNTPTTDAARSQLPEVTGTPGVPVLSLHGIGDLFVPLKMEQVYQRQVIANGQGRLYVGRAIRSVGHCDFSQTELSEGFADLVTWVQRGQRPAGDDLLSRRAVADPAFGCAFTRDPHANFTGTAACPTLTR